jgi:hypothetical protein
MSLAKPFASSFSPERTKQGMSGARLEMIKPFFIKTG